MNRLDVNCFVYSSNCCRCYLEMSVDGCSRLWSRFTVVDDALVAHPSRSQRHCHADQFIIGVFVTVDLVALAVQRAWYGAFIVFQFHRRCCLLGRSRAGSSPIALFPQETPRSCGYGVSARIPFYFTKRCQLFITSLNNDYSFIIVQLGLATWLLVYSFLKIFFGIAVYSPPCKSRPVVNLPLLKQALSSNIVISTDSMSGSCVSSVDNIKPPASMIESSQHEMPSSKLDSFSLKCSVLDPSYFDDQLRRDGLLHQLAILEQTVSLSLSLHFFFF